MSTTDSTASSDPYERGKLAGRRLGGYAAFATARRALREAGPIVLARILNQLASVEDLAEALRQLEDAADRAGEHS